MTIRALVFDFDGLIVDTELPSYLSWQEAWRAHGVELTLPVWGERIGTAGSFDPAAEIERRGGRPFTAAAADRRRAHRDELVRATQPLPGVTDYLATAARLGLKIAIASSSSHAWVDEHLARLGLAHYFTCRSCFDELGGLAAKPAPDLYRAAVELLAVKPAEAIAFEDSAPGVTAAKAAGLHCVAVPNHLTRAMDLTAADVVLDSLAARPLEELIADLGLG